MASDWLQINAGDCWHIPRPGETRTMGCGVFVAYKREHATHKGPLPKGQAPCAKCVEWNASKLRGISKSLTQLRRLGGKRRRM